MQAFQFFSLLNIKPSCRCRFKSTCKKAWGTFWATDVIGIKIFYFLPFSWWKDMPKRHSWHPRKKHQFPRLLLDLFFRFDQVFKQIKDFASKILQGIEYVPNNIKCLDKSVLKSKPLKHCSACKLHNHFLWKPNLTKIDVLPSIIRSSL